MVRSRLDTVKTQTRTTDEELAVSSDHNTNSNTHRAAAAAAAAAARTSAPGGRKGAPICRFFALRGECRNGDRCAFSHELPDGGYVEARKTIPCQFFAKGNCRYGQNCCFLHESPESKKTPQGDIIDTTCGICLDQVQSQGHKFGLLSCCDHVFCFECLMEWRKEGSKEADDRRCCPTCRKHSDFVVPSVTVAIGDEKTRVVEEFKTKLSVIPCKNFDGELGSCPFGSDCFYAHFDDDGNDVKSNDQSCEEIHRQRRRRRRSRRSSSYDRDLEEIELMLMLTFLEMTGRGYGYYDDSDDDSSDGEY